MLFGTLHPVFQLSLLPKESVIELMQINLYQLMRIKKSNYFNLWKLVIEPMGPSHTTIGLKTSSDIKENMTAGAVLKKTENAGAFWNFQKF